MKKKKLTSERASERASRRNNMDYKFNEDQLNIIQHCLDIQEEIWLKNKSNREYYDADLRRLKECKDIINQQASEQKG